MWKDPDTRTAVCWRWLKMRGIEDYVEDVFHPKIHGKEPRAVATLSLRILLGTRDEITKFQDDDQQGGITFKGQVLLGFIPSKPQGLSHFDHTHPCLVAETHIGSRGATP